MERLEQIIEDSAYLLDGLPHDDFRYGMERAIEIINKHKIESEGTGNA